MVNIVIQVQGMCSWFSKDFSISSAVVNKTPLGNPIMIEQAYKLVLKFFVSPIVRVWGFQNWAQDF